MRLLIDAREALLSRPAGKGRWTRAFLRELTKRSGSECTLLVRDLTACARMFPQSRAEVINGRGISWHFRAARRAKELRPDFYVSPTSYIVPWILGRQIATAVVVHDLIAFRKEPHDFRATFIERSCLPRVTRTAAKLFTASEATKRDLCSHFPMLPEAHVSPLFAASNVDPLPRVPDGRTILCVATLCPRKNQKRLIQAFAALPDDLRARSSLVLAGGRGWHDEEIVRLAQQTAGVEWIGYVDDARYRELLRTCQIAALPSLYEGFGMQVLEALACAVPVLTSDRGSLREVAGSAAHIVDPESVSSISEGLRQLLTDAELRDQLAQAGPRRAAQFTWKRTVDLFLEGLQQSLAIKP